MTLDALIEKAKAATPGPWTVHTTGKDVDAVQENGDWCSVTQTDTTEDAAYIAALSPEVVIALCEVARAGKAVDEVLHAEREVDNGWRDEEGQWHPLPGKLSVLVGKRSATSVALTTALAHLDYVMGEKA